MCMQKILVTDYFFFICFCYNSLYLPIVRFCILNQCGLLGMVVYQLELRTHTTVMHLVQSSLNPEI
jgi:hypothetical protein